MRGAIMPEASRYLLAEKRDSA
ncbi:protein of unknown function [Xenorhabdus doucetiae]|uniref:Uncharacterized protein n=1 Tax=Xenorhabdus doucetiae TaxID=351671 RepID=A0A068QR68_9GAMM|nr:protein of unknown function [Xenorhabdus doucetiae]